MGPVYEPFLILGERVKGEGEPDRKRKRPAGRNPASGLGRKAGHGTFGRRQKNRKKGREKCEEEIF